ncbi:MAG: MurT ligase domain-containing protein [Actinomycetota bacterium]|nr:MurT ligase domain-containing protein [Actinomycetota bacterium]
MRPPVPLAVEIAVARLAGRVSRLAGAGGGTTLPGKILAAVDPDAVSRLAARLRLGSAIVTATNGKTTTTSMVAEILRGRVRLAHNRAGANLVSGVTSALLESGGGDLGLFEVDEGAFPEVSRRIRPRAVCLGNLFRDQLDRYGELELIAERWRGAVAELDPAASVVANADDPLIANLVRGRQNVVRFGVDDPNVARERLPHAADSKYCVDCGTPYVYEAAYVGHLGAYRCPGCDNSRPPLEVVARSVRLSGLEGSSFLLTTPQGKCTISLPLPGLYNVYNALAAASLGLVLGATLDEISAALVRFRPAFGRFERIRVADRSVLVLLVKNPAGANEAVRTLVDGDAPALAVVALNDQIADGRDVSWIWDADFEPLVESLERLVATGSRAHELALRFKYAGLEPDRIEIVPNLGRALDRALELTPPGGVLPVLPTYTAMLALREIAVDRGLVRPYWEETAT